MNFPMHTLNNIQVIKALPDSPRMPAIFIGHGNPMNAITQNPFKDAWLALGEKLPKPRAILCVSAHWQTRGTQICTAECPKTIHDFSGFPEALYQQLYPAPGSPAYAEITRELFAKGIISNNSQWGLDHGAWCVLQAIFPDADIPVFELSLNIDLDCAAHFALAKQLAALRQRGVMIIGSGNIVHNLGMLSPQGETANWAQDFDAYIKQALEKYDDDALIHYERAGLSAQMAVPTNEHYLPLLYIAAVRHPNDKIQFFTEAFDLGTLSMRSVIYQ